jgi:hypothetical protein
MCKSKYLVIFGTTVNIVTTTAKISNKSITQQTDDFSKAMWVLGNQKNPLSLNKEETT